MSAVMTAAVKQSLFAALRSDNFDGDAEISVLFTDGLGIRKLNRRHRKIDSETDVLSFPIGEVNPENGFNNLGDIVINIDRVYKQAAEFGQTPVREAAFLAAHSALHLLGYDHEDKDDELIMRNQQRVIMALLGFVTNTD